MFVVFTEFFVVCANYLSKIGIFIFVEKLINGVELV